LWAHCGPWHFDSEGQLSREQTFNIPRLTSASGTKQSLSHRKKPQVSRMPGRWNSYGEGQFWK